MSKENVLLLYNAHNVKYEKCQLYGDFIKSLLLLMFDTYLGDEITGVKEQKKHFKWCWDTNILNFTKEGLSFENNKLFEYFSEFTTELFYLDPEKDDAFFKHKDILKIYDYIFDYGMIKSKSDIDMLVEIYRIFENSLNNEKITK